MRSPFLQVVRRAENARDREIELAIKCHENPNDKQLQKLLDQAADMADELDTQAYDGRFELPE